MTWSKADHEERIRELDIAKGEALGTFMGMVDAVMLAADHPDVFNMAEKIVALREARKVYYHACAAHIDARLNAWPTK